MVVEALHSQWLRGVTDLLVLACLSEDPGYGYALVERLTKAGIGPLSEATVYGALRRLEGSDRCVSELVASESGPARRYYSLNALGRTELAELTEQWRAFSTAVGNVVHGEGR